MKVRPHDADVRPYDRVSLQLDLDRDYSTYFQLQVDQRGCVCEDCWGDLTWNPRWFVAVDSGSEGWVVEAAIPMVELTGEAWALAFLTIGVYAWHTSPRRRWVARWNPFASPTRASDLPVS